ncbi:hypothetical protein [Dyella sp. 2HG41-7]|uniref:hypothetical protein n=1 Tax=Dyella sp. 2HG41-7 TaxID=2883239 RepID=UPI001F250F31|nr:hypothetical protein [Dyella sp. 2HG41-7]
MLAGCATSRSEIKLHSPEVVAPTTTATSAQRVVVIGKITDERVFEDSPTEPSTPSLGFGGADKATGDVKARAVGRKRNTYGKALGDVLLQQGDTVESVIRKNLAAAFQQAGYQVKDAADAGSSALVVDVHIKKFWAWFDPGFWAITLNDNIVTDLVVNGAPAPVVISTHVEDKRQVATEDAWIQIVDKGLDAYRAEVASRMQGSDGAKLAAATPSAPSAPAPVKAAPTPVADPTPATVPSEQPVAPATVTPDATSAAADAPAAQATAPTTLASSADTSTAQEVATQIGCGSVQANGDSTFVAPCGTYSVMIGCNGGECRPMHTVNVKKDE